MPELPEVEVLARHLGPALHGRTVSEAQVRRAKSVRPDSPSSFAARLVGARFVGVARRGKYLRFGLEKERGGGGSFEMLGHLGMTGRMYVQAAGVAPAPHAAVILGLDDRQFVFEDPRYFGRLSFDTRAIEGLGPEPLGPAFTVKALGAGLAGSRQPIKVKLLDQSLVAGLGNIYAAEALFRAGLSPRLQSGRLSAPGVSALWQAIRQILAEAIEWGSTVPLDWAGQWERDGWFYYGRAPGASDSRPERLQVYGREGQPCLVCGTAIRRLAQAGRSTFFCPACQAARPRARRADRLAAHRVPAGASSARPTGG
jgi:formamidopyrimidine-DNA glycosylase